MAVIEAIMMMDRPFGTKCQMTMTTVDGDMRDAFVGN
jgi:hypothetical protein